MTDLRNRLSPDWFADDACFAVGPGRGTPADSTAIWLPERMMDRIRHVAQAYHLHLLPLIDACAPTYFSAQQAGHLVDELAFVRELVADPYLQQWSDRLIALIGGAGRSDGVTFEGP